MARGRWGDRALDQLAKRVDALEATIGRLLSSEHGPRLGGVGIGTWIAFAAGVAVPIFAALYGTGRL